MFACACPKQELFFAIGIEVTVFIGLVTWRFFRSQSKGGKAKSVVLSELTSGEKTKIAKQIYERSATVLWLLAATIISFDFAAFTSAFCGDFNKSQKLYTKMPVSIAVGLHPAATLEMLSGAYVEAKNYPKAEHLYATIEKIRLQTYGASHEMMVALYTDFGDLFCKQMQLEKAASYYLRAIELSKRINGPSGYGRPLTGLANTLRDRGRYAEANTTYSEALSLRQELYGADSEKVAETKKEYAILLAKEGHGSEASVMALQAKAVLNKGASSNTTNTYLPIVICIGSIIVSVVLFGRSGILTRLATIRLRAKAEKSTASPAEIKNLVALYNFQGQTEAAKLMEKQHSARVLDKTRIDV